MKPTRTWASRAACLRYAQAKLGARNFQTVWNAHDYLRELFLNVALSRSMHDALTWLEGDGLRMLGRIAPGLREMEKRLRQFSAVAVVEGLLPRLHAGALSISRDLDALRNEVRAGRPEFLEQLSFSGDLVEAWSPFKRFPRSWAGDPVRFGLATTTLMADERFPLSPWVWAHLGIGFGIDPVPKERLISGELRSPAMFFRERVVAPWKKVIEQARPDPNAEVREKRFIDDSEIDPGPYLSGAKTFSPPHPSDPVRPR